MISLGAAAVLGEYDGVIIYRKMLGLVTSAKSRPAVVDYPNAQIRK